MPLPLFYAENKLYFYIHNKLIINFDFGGILLWL